MVWSRPRLLVVGLTAVFGGSISCSLLYNTDEISKGDGGTCDGCNSAPADVHADLAIFDGPEGTCACVDNPPAGFRGPLATWDGPSAPPSCGGQYTASVFDGFADLTGGPAACGCTCGAATGVTCPSSFAANLFGNNQCTGNKCDTVTLAVKSCVGVQANCFSVFGINATITPSGGSCVAQPTMNIPPNTWGRNVRLCEETKLPVQGACTSGQLCVPLPTAPYEFRPCISSMGDVACPTFYSYKRLVYTGATDTRGCSACTCGNPTGTCSATIQSGCNGGMSQLSNACVGLGDPSGIMLKATPIFAGSCSAMGGQAMGSLTPSGPTTVCCVP